ncbi:uncharacterized protein AB9X84_011079 [Acanthopagrus schlegelii]
MSKSSLVARAPGVGEKGNTQSMDCLESLEIYIPVEAEVKTICLWSLPNSVLKRMGLPLYDTEGSRKLAESPEGIWICPAVLRKKGQRPTSSAENSMTENMSSLMGKAFRGGTGPFRMSFVSSNHAAYNILQDTMPKGQVSAHMSRSSQLHPSSAPQTYQDAIVIYHGRIYLSIRKPSRSQHKQETRGPKPASQFSVLSTSHVSSKSQTKRQSPEASLDPADKHLKRTRLNVPVPEISSNQPDDLTKVDDHSTTYKELTAEKATCHESAWFHLRGEQEAVVSNDTEIQNSVSEEADGTSQNNDGGECDNIVGVVEHSSNQSWSKRASQETACASTSLQQEYDELAQEEEISQMKAKLRLSEAVLNNMYSSL